MTRHAEPGTLPYIYTDGEAFENIAQPAPRLLYSVPSPSSLHSTSWHIPTVPDTSTTVSQTPEQPAYTNPARDFARPGHYYHGREFPPSRGYYDARALEHPLESPSASSQFANPRGMIDQHYPATTAYPVTYTDDAGLKLCDRVRRQCFNCKATTTTTWRRSMLSPGKLVCNKCGLFERTHAVPRPKTFPRRRRSPRSSAYPYPNADPPAFNHPESRHHNDRRSAMPLTGHIPGAFGPMGGETSSQNATWMTDNVSSTPTRFSPSHTVSQPTTYRADFYLPSIIPAEAAYPSIHLGDYHIPMGIDPSIPRC